MRIPKEGDIIKWKNMFQETKDDPFHINKIVKIETLDNESQRFFTTEHLIWIDDGTWIRDNYIHQIFNDNTEKEAIVEDFIIQITKMHRYFRKQVCEVKDIRKRLLYQKFEK